MLDGALDLNLGESSDSTSTGAIIRYALIGLLALGAIKNYVRRETVEPPKLLGKQEAGAKQALRTGLIVILLVPSDLIIPLTVGANLDQSNSSLADALPFIGATVLVAALPCSATGSSTAAR